MPRLRQLKHWTGWKTLRATSLQEKPNDENAKFIESNLARYLNRMMRPKNTYLCRNLHYRFMSDRFNNIYRIPSARAAWHDYDGGFYHVTICTANRERYFGRIIVGENGNIMELSSIGKYAMEQFQNVQKHYPYAHISCFIVMPDHIHAIVHLAGRDVARYVSDNENQSLHGRDIARYVSIDNQLMDRLGDVARNVSYRKGTNDEKRNDVGDFSEGKFIGNRHSGVEIGSFQICP